MTRWSFLGHPVTASDPRDWVDRLVLTDNRDGTLVVRYRTERHIPARKATRP